MLRRLDAELVRRGLARSRDDARSLVDSGLVLVDGVVAVKVTRQVSDSVSLVVSSNEAKWVSRGAHKLLGALETFKPLGLNLRGRVVLDAGASTGGFTQVCLAENVSQVVAVDVGYGQLAWPVRTDPRVIVMERFNVRNLSKADLKVDVDLVVADLSFISLVTVLPALVSSTTEDADLVLMVKPQFEVGKADIGDGIVRSPELRASAVDRVISEAQKIGAGFRAVGASPLPGPQGNVEYFVWLTKGFPVIDGEQCAIAVQTAIEEGPQ
ncbi:MAG: rRNA (cytidine-2-O)-methyltransferase TlyA [Actinomycetota bacterium]